jgi:hypothetical protein
LRPSTRDLLVQLRKEAAQYPEQRQQLNPLCRNYPRSGKLKIAASTTGPTWLDPTDGGKWIMAARELQGPASAKFLDIPLGDNLDNAVSGRGYNQDKYEYQ